MSTAPATATRRQALFRRESATATTARIPVLAASGPWLLACCERRHGGDDWSGMTIPLRRSADGGATWDAPRDIHASPADPRPNPRAAPYRGAHEAAARTHGNPVLIHAGDGTVHLIHCFEYHRVLHRVSHDHGATWGPAAEITAALTALHARYPWQVCATGPGHGIRLRSGRLVVPVWLSLASGGHGHRPSVVTTLYSDDGVAWRAGDLVAVDGGHARDGERLVNPSEAALAELPDGRVLISMRSEGPANRRLHAWSDDGGATFGQPRMVSDLLEPVCQASMVTGPDGALWFSAPEPLDAAQVASAVKPRRRLRLATSRDGLAWRTAAVIDPGIAGYSHLAWNDGKLWCLYEHSAEGGQATVPDELALVRVPLEGA